jgi:hypothetical protein
MNQDNDNKFSGKVRYEYQQNPDVRIHYAHGVWGGINPQGEIEVNFYLESDKIPPHSERLIAPDGSFGHEVIPYEEEVRAVTRTIHSRVILNYYTARAVLEWLEDKLDMLEMEDGSAPLTYEGSSDVEQ